VRVRAVIQQLMFQNRYPVSALELAKTETSCRTVDAIVAHFERCIAAAPGARLIAVFDHYWHTRELGGAMDPAIRTARNVIFCFGRELPGALLLALRPRAIGIADLGERFAVSYMEPPMPSANEAMASWLRALRDREAGVA
jgi:hypothetical protein